jgi:hypothetical protein
MAVAGHAAVEADPVGQQVDVFVLGVDVPREHILIEVKPHAVQVAGPDLAPLRVRQVFARCGRQRDVEHRLAQARAQLADLAEFRGQLACVGACHVRVDHAPTLLVKVVFEGAAKAAALDGFSDHRTPL